MLGSRHNQLDHSSLKPSSEGLEPSISRFVVSRPIHWATRTLSCVSCLRVQQQLFGLGSIPKRSASCRVRTCAFFRILELKSSALDHSAKKAYSLKERAPAGSRTRVLQLGTVDDNRYTTGAECVNAKHYSKKEVLPGFEPGSPDSESEVLTSYTIRPNCPNTPGGTRTHNLTLRRGTRYPLRYGG